MSFDSPKTLIYICFFWSQLWGAKSGSDRGETLGLFVTMMRETATAALGGERLQPEARLLGDCLDALVETTQALLAYEDPLLRLANATVYLDAFSHIVIGWIWLRQALAAAAALARNDVSEADLTFYEGKLPTCRYFSRYELPFHDAPCAVQIARSRLPRCAGPHIPRIANGRK